MEKYRAILVDVDHEEVRQVYVSQELEEYYNLLDCYCIDVATRCVGGRWYDIICDDNGLFKEKQKISAIDGNGKPMFVGNILLTQHDNDGNLLDLSDEDIIHAFRFIGRVCTNNYPLGYDMLGCCEYFDEHGCLKSEDY